MRIFRNWQDKKRERFVKLLQEFWNDLSYEKQKQFRHDYFGLYLTIMTLIGWNENV